MQNFVSKTPIEKGFSGDKKYFVTDKNGTKYFLRIYDIKQYESAKQEFELMGRVAELGVPMCKPLEFGICEDGVYALHQWIEGADAEPIIGSFSEMEQYSFGLEAGRALKLIHGIPAPPETVAWESFFANKMDKKLKMYEQCPIKYHNGEAFINYINENRHIIKGRPSTFQHGDYHVGNTMIGSDNRLYIIDFNRKDFGDPWEEFNRIVWSAQASPLFASGTVDGYFDNCVPEEFWRLMALYISSNTLGSAYWAVQFGDKETRIMIEQAADVLSWYDNMNNPIPAWYSKPNNP